MNIFELERILDAKLNAKAIKDYAPNGLQIEGRHEVKKIITGVTASMRLIEAAIERKADLILVHHGYFWRGEDMRLIHAKYRRIKALMQHDIGLMGYHLPLDMAPEIGNNARLGQLLNIQAVEGLDPHDSNSLILKGRLATPMTGEAFGQVIEKVLNRTPLHIPSERDQLIETVAWCSGGAQDYIDQAALAGVDAYLTGEASERTTHSAREMDIHFYGAGHHATERYGIEALGKWLAQTHQLDVEFIDCDNPV
ncbi:Nif3-like dinuclear metal center hexameric protein [Wohlfahrtiimonas chitiniclastica]|uniref:Nif3-like dinuclear metal center hexameric protein n=1 Tax=Wohlfahrtiimonas chitiniclastica TaxID=400946 RepID=UPI000B98D253|nr:Nif3-like dinuclear metal center hexameric protein [Wohlfahrtiimonas chitiniclastica]OYQ78990.1 Nif3-like dinuclear metal center hexameric protein [Wohlfahrtiimonas chitiniclastica]